MAKATKDMLGVASLTVVADAGYSMSSAPWWRPRVPSYWRPSPRPSTRMRWRICFSTYRAAQDIDG
jgi:hypothetical protein